MEAVHGESGVKPPHPKLKFARFLARPALHDDFRFGVELHGVAPLSVQNTEETFFPSAERKISHGRGDADVDANISGGRFLAKLSGSSAAGRKKRSLISIRTAAQKFQGRIDGIDVHKA